MSVRAYDCEKTCAVLDLKKIRLKLVTDGRLVAVSFALRDVTFTPNV
jgi:hypothetical protein